jgi:DNA-binding CsgD family transcriptional regulator
MAPMIEIALPPHRAPFDPAGGSLRSSTVLLVAPAHAVWAPLTAGLLNSGIGRVLRAESIAAVDHIIDHQPAGDLALVSGSMQAKRNRVVRRLRAAGWHRVLQLTDVPDSDSVRAALLAHHGALAALDDNDVARPEHDLSKKQVSILQQLARGRSIKKISKNLGISTSGVKAHIGRMAEKLGSDDVVEAGLRAGLIT